MFTRKHMNALAELLKNARENAWSNIRLNKCNECQRINDNTSSRLIDDLEAEIIHILAQSNPRFSISRFKTASKFEPVTEEQKLPV